MQKTAIFITFLLTLSLQCMNMSVYDDKIYILDGFNRELFVFNDDGSKEHTVCLKNISRSGYFDFFIKRDRFYSLIHDCFNGSVYVLDEKYEVRKTITLKNIYEEEIAPKIYPAGSSSMFFSTSDYLSIYILRDNRARMIILSEIPYTDFFSDGKNIFLLYNDHISVYTVSGIFIKKIPLPLPETPYSSLYITSSHIFLHNLYGITYLKKDLSDSGFMEDMSIISYAGTGDTLFYSSIVSKIKIWRAKN